MNIEEFLAYWTHHRIRSLVDEIWLNTYHADNAFRVIGGESSFQPLVFNMYGGTWHAPKVYRVRGLMQISDIHKGSLPSYPATLDDQLVFEPRRNLTIAKELWIRDERKWSKSWTAARKLEIE